MYQSASLFGEELIEQSTKRKEAVKVPFHLIESVRQLMVTAAFFQSILCEITVVSVLLTTLSYVPDNSVKHTASAALRDSFTTRKCSFSHPSILL